MKSRKSIEVEDGISHPPTWFSSATSNQTIRIRVGSVRRRTGANNVSRD